MKRLRFILIICAVVLFIGYYEAYSQDKTSSGVIVFGPTEKSTTQSTPIGTEISVGEPLKPNQPGEGPKVKITGPELNGSFRVIYDIKGSRIGSTQVSDAVALPADGMITAVDPGMGQAFTIVRIDEDKKETLFLNISPEHAIGQRLPKGTYKVYPLDPDGKFANEKLTAKVQVGLVGNDVMDPRARGELYKTEKE